MKKLLLSLFMALLIFTACGAQDPDITPAPQTEKTPLPVTTHTPAPVLLTPENIDSITEFYDPDSGKKYSVDIRNNHTSDGVEYYIFNIMSDTDSKWLTARVMDGQLEYMTAQTDKIGRDFADNGYWVETEGRNIYKLYCKTTNYVFTADFDKMTVDFSYREPQKTDDYIKLAEKNGYTLYRANHEGGGDITYYNILLCNNRTGEETVLTKGGGMYGGGTETGFFSNGDVYILNYDGFETFDITGKKLVKLGDYFPFGNLEEGNLRHRILRAVRRDPVDGTYLAVYFEEEKWNKYEDRFLNYNDNQLQLKAKYKVGYFDKYGYLLREYETDANAIMAMGYATVDMRLEGTDTVKFFSWHKYRDSNRYNSVTLNLTSGKSTVDFDAFA